MDLHTRPDTKFIENLDRHLAVFPDWNLNDGNVQCRFTAATTEPAVCELDVFLPGGWRRADLVTPTPSEYCVTIRFRGVRNLVMWDCDPPHVAGELVITAVPAGQGRVAHRRVVYASIAGLEFELECQAISVVDVVPIDRRAAV